MSKLPISETIAATREGTDRALAGALVREHFVMFPKWTAPADCLHALKELGLDGRFSFRHIHSITKCPFYGD